MLKLNAEDEKELFKRMKIQEEQGEEYLFSENKQMESLLPLTERVRQSPFMIEKWENALLVAGGTMEDMEKRLKIDVGIVVGCIVFSLILMLAIVFLRLDSAYVMLATGAILIVMTVALVFFFLGLKWFLTCGVHKEWRPFLRYIRKHKIITLKFEIDTIVNGIRQMKEDYSRAKEDIQRIKKQEWLSQEELEWASIRMQISDPPKHTVNLVENLLKWEEE